MASARLGSLNYASVALARFGMVALALGALALGALVGCGDAGTPALTRLAEARRLTTALRVEMARAAKAENRAVMADTDEASRAFAAEAARATDAIQKDLDAVEPLVRGLDFSDEMALVAAFRTAFVRYLALDHEILSLAVENTNLKAQRLSFGSAHAAADRLEQALLPIGQAGARSETALAARVLALVAVVSVREIELLEAPHIAEAHDAAMTELEQQMATLDGKARSALEELARSNEPAARSIAPLASAALAEFETVHAQIIALSRRNTNVRSLALSLGEQFKLASVCESSLSELNDQLGRRAFPATR